MRVRFHGAVNGTVTGSMHELVDERLGVHILVDCGVVQGEADADERNAAAFPFDPHDVTHVLLTHAHLDHCGRLPLLFKRGFAGIVTCSIETEKLARINLEEAARQSDLFTLGDVERVRFGRWSGPFYGKAHPLTTDVLATPMLSSHLLGACSYQVTWRDEGGERRNATFSGDVGVNSDAHAPLPLARPGHTPYVPHDPKEAVVVIESTYGGVQRPSITAAERREFIREEIERIVDSEGTLLIPAFAIQRTQDVLFDLHVVLHESGLISTVPVYLDAPMAQRANKVFAESIDASEPVEVRRQTQKVRWLVANPEELSRLGLDPAVDVPVFADMVRIALGERPDDRAAMEAHPTALASSWRTALTQSLPSRGPRIIVAGSGMCLGGRIIEHLRSSLGRSNTTVMLTGFAPASSPAGKLSAISELPASERAKLKGGLGLPGDDVLTSAVAARIVRAPGYSGHASEAGLIDWLFPTVPRRPTRKCAGARVFVVHGSPQAQRALATAIVDAAARFGVECPHVTVVTDSLGWVDLGDSSGGGLHPDPIQRAIALAESQGEFDLAEALRASQKAA